MPYFVNRTKKIIKSLNQEKEFEDKHYYPKRGEILKAFRMTPYEEVKVVIVGQDPYPTPGMAHGLAFSVKHGVIKPRTLVNIHKELNSDLGVLEPDHGNLEGWAIQGVLLMNRCLTTAPNALGSHLGKYGWEDWTRNILENLSKKGDIVFILWGNKAQEILKSKEFRKTKNLVIATAHPSPQSAWNGFFGSKPFSKANEYLIEKGKRPIDWGLL